MEIEFENNLKNCLVDGLGAELADRCSYETVWDDDLGKYHLDFEYEGEQKELDGQKIADICKTALADALYETYDIDFNANAMDDCVVGDYLSISFDYDIGE